MFTGLIEEVGEVRAVRNIGGGRRITVAANKILDDIKIDDSVSLNGACQTVVALGDKTFEVEAVEETLRKSTLGSFRPGRKINLERAAKLGDRMGGHLVQGHVDCTGAVNSIEKQQTGILVWINYSTDFSRYVINAGSIAVEGVSLTVAREEPGKFMLSVIPHTWGVTTLNSLKPGDEVNLEFDLIGKYVEKMLGGIEKKPSPLDKYISQPGW